MKTDDIVALANLESQMGEIIRQNRPRWNGGDVDAYYAQSACAMRATALMQIAGKVKVTTIKTSKAPDPDNVSEIAEPVEVDAVRDNEDPITPDLVAHLREVIMHTIADDPKFYEAVNAQVGASWKAAELHDLYIMRAFGRAFILEM